MKLKDALNKYATPFSEELGIDLHKRPGIFKWFLAALLFGKRINETIAKRTYKTFEKRALTSPDAILGVGWDGLVKALDEGGYVRYDFSTADKLLDIAKTLKQKYDGDLNKLHDAASGAEDLEKRLMEFNGIGEVTAQIFLRELRGVWSKADPQPSHLEVLAGKRLGLMKVGNKGELKKAAGTVRMPVVNLEVALLRIGKDFCRKKRCKVCDFKGWCLAWQGHGKA